MRACLGCALEEVFHMNGSKLHCLSIPNRNFPITRAIRSIQSQYPHRSLSTVLLGLVCLYRMIKEALHVGESLSLYVSIHLHRTIVIYQIDSESRVVGDICVDMERSVDMES